MGELKPGRRFENLRKLLERPFPFDNSCFEPSPAVFEFVRHTCKILVIGAGGLGCELLKDIALNGFTQIDVIDMDTIELSNLNRQFLFREADIGLSKAEVAANFINKRVKGCHVVPHFCKIQDFDQWFYGQFHVVVCGLDSIMARRWINGMLISRLVYRDNVLDLSSVIALIDGGTEGLNGNARVILPGLTACIDCTLNLYPVQTTYPLCTLANTPRLPEHCIEYVKLMEWKKEDPFGAPINGDDPEHIQWIYEKSRERALRFKITPPTYRLVQGVIKNIIPAVASTNAVISGICATEVFKIASRMCRAMSNFMNFTDSDGIYTHTFQAEQNPDCIACSQVPKNLEIKDLSEMKLKDLIQILRENPSFKMKNPGLTTVIDGSTKTLYISTIPCIEGRTRANLEKTLPDLGLGDNSEVYVADITTPQILVLKLKCF